MGGDRTEVFNAVPVDDRDRTKEIGPVKEIEVRVARSLVFWCLFRCFRAGLPSIFLAGKER
jgi:hypothetical protein